jgi:hypothetical protein
MQTSDPPRSFNFRVVLGIIRNWPQDALLGLEIPGYCPQVGLYQPAMQAIAGLALSLGDYSGSGLDCRPTCRL